MSLNGLQDTISTSDVLEPSTIAELEKVVTERQQSLDALEEMKLGHSN